MTSHTGVAPSKHYTALPNNQSTSYDRRAGFSLYNRTIVDSTQDLFLLTWARISVYNGTIVDRICCLHGFPGLLMGTRKFPGK